MNNFDKDIETLVFDKQLCGFKFDYSCAINNFKNFLMNDNYDEVNLTKELVEKWLDSLKDKKHNTLMYYQNFIRQLGLSMNKYGKQAYILPSFEIGEKDNFIPHIYSNKELLDFFNAVYKIENSKYYPWKSLMFPLAYKLAYCCGLRNSEIRNIKLEDIDLKNMSIVIRNSKNYNNRIIYYDEELTEEITNIYNNNRNFSEYLFYDANGHKLRDQVLIKNFRKVWLSIGIDGSNYRIHDFRHTFAVNNLRKCFLEGKDSNVFLPSLMMYMGHSKLESTEYYLRLINTTFPYLNKKIEDEIVIIIPEYIGD